LFESNLLCAGKLNAQLNWVITAFTLTSTAFIPAFGQLADIFGRHSALQLSLVFMLIGSALCAGAQAWGMLLLGRALQGVSAAGINNLIEIILADNVSLEDNAKNNTIFTLISGFAFSAGPVVGGFLTQADWRWCFVLSIPVTVISHIILFFVIRKELRQGTQTSLSRNWKASIIGLSTIDTLGTILFILGTGLIILAITWGDCRMPGTRPQSCCR
jgi:MFS family permease